jgi:hypothetical protein
MTKKRSNPARDALRSAGTAIRAGQTMNAAASVIAARTEMASLDPANPSAATQAEMGRMVSEKVDAFSKAGVAAAEGASEFARQASEFAVGEAAKAGHSLEQLARCTTPAEAALLQTRHATDFFTRSLAFGMALNALVIRTGENALRPVHRAVTRNHKRLRPKG